MTPGDPDEASGSLALPIKRVVRAANGLEAGDTATIHLRVAGEASS